MNPTTEIIFYFFETVLYHKVYQNILHVCAFPLTKVDLSIIYSCICKYIFGISDVIGINFDSLKLLTRWMNFKKAF